MATRAKTSSSTPRKRVGAASKKQSAGSAAKSATSRVVDTGARSPAEVQAAKQAEADLSQRTFVAGNVHSFQLRAERRRKDPDGFIEVVPQAELMLRGGAIEVDDETLGIVENVLEGRHSDGNVDARHFQRIARQAGLRIIRPGLVSIPMKSWDVLDEREVVSVALKSGELVSRGDVERALAYEQQAALHTPKRAPRVFVIEQLERVLAAFNDDDVDVAVAVEPPLPPMVEVAVDATPIMFDAGGEEL